MRPPPQAIGNAARLIGAAREHGTPEDEMTAVDQLGPKTRAALNNLPFPISAASLARRLARENPGKPLNDKALDIRGVKILEKFCVDRLVDERVIDLEDTLEPEIVRSLLDPLKPNGRARRRHR